MATDIIARGMAANASAFAKEKFAGGTTNQVLTKNSSTDLDFSWKNPTAESSIYIEYTGESVVSETTFEEAYSKKESLIRIVSFGYSFEGYGLCTSPQTVQWADEDGYKYIILVFSGEIEGYIIWTTESITFEESSSGDNPTYTVDKYIY